MRLENSLKFDGWVCPYCDKLNDTNQEYCPSCGSARTANVIPVFCDDDDKKDNGLNWIESMEEASTLEEEKSLKFVKLIDGKEVKVPSIYVNGKWVSTNNFRKIVYNGDTKIKKIVFPSTYPMVYDVDETNEKLASRINGQNNNSSDNQSSDNYGKSRKLIPLIKRKK